MTSACTAPKLSALPPAARFEDHRGFTLTLTDGMQPTSADVNERAWSRETREGAHGVVERPARGKYDHHAQRDQRGTEESSKESHLMRRAYALKVESREALIIMRKTVGLAVLGLVMALTSGGAEAQRPVGIDVFKDVTCGCCANWVEHLRRSGFAPTSTNVDDITAVKNKHNVPAQARSCHTALVEGYVVEGHVPAAQIQRLLKDRPAIRGLAVPGMPIGSPGMEGPNARPYDVLAFDKNGRTTVFATERP